MKYLLIAIIFTQATVDHGPSIRRHLGTYQTIEECELNLELMKGLYEEGSLWMAPNEDPEPIARVSYACMPDLE